MIQAFLPGGRGKRRIAADGLTGTEKGGTKRQESGDDSLETKQRDFFLWSVVQLFNELKLKLKLRLKLRLKLGAPVGTERDQS